MNFLKQTKYTEMKAGVVEREFRDRIRRDRKYLLLHSALILLCAAQWIWRNIDPDYEHSGLVNILYFFGFVSMTTLTVLVLKIITDYYGTMRKLRFLRSLRN